MVQLWGQEWDRRAGEAVAEADDALLRAGREVANSWGKKRGLLWLLEEAEDAGQEFGEGSAGRDAVGPSFPSLG